MIQCIMITPQKLGIIIGIIAIIGISYWLMNKKIVSAPVGAGEAVVLPGGTAPSAQPAAIKNAMHTITIETQFGNIRFETYDADAPKTVENFITLARKDFYNNLIFHRIIKGFMIQGGDPNGTGTGGPGYTFADELNPATESYKAGYQKGVVAMANAGPDTNGSQFFIMLEDTPLSKNYTIFGKVISGQDVVDKIGGDATGANDKPINPIKMDKVYIVE